MGQKLNVFSRVVTTRSLWFAGLTFIMIVTFQVVNIQFRNDISSLSSKNEIPISRYGSTQTIMSSSKSETLDNTAHVNTMSFPNAFPVPEVAETEGGFNGKKAGLVEEHLFYSEKKDNLGLRDTFIEDDTDKGSPDFSSETKRSSNEKFSSPSPALPPEDLLTDIASPEDADVDVNYGKNEKLEILENESDHFVESLAPEVKKITQVSGSGVASISEMMNLLHQSHTSHLSLRPSRRSPADQELSSARTEIENPPMVENDPLLYTYLYWNVSMFKRSYELMEKMLKVYVYKEGERPIMHKPVLKGIYASEGWFMKQLKMSKTFVTKDPRKSHLFYLPFSSRMLEETLYVPGSHSNKNLIEFLKKYLDMISTKYPFWNRTGGSDHFLVACHDWAPSETRQYMAKCIRALCNSDVKEGFVFGKDVALPETSILVPRKPLRGLGGKPSSKRSVLAFFAGGMHGYVRPLLLKHWGGNKDPDMKIFNELPKSKNKKSYAQHMKSSKYCICPKGYEVNSPRVVEAIFYECVPVIISDNFVPPFFEVLNWESFSLFVLEKDIPSLKNILLSIPEKRYREMQMRVKMVQRHFLWHPKPEKYDIFHMILHSVWYNRVFQS